MNRKIPATRKRVITIVSGLIISAGFFYVAFNGFKKMAFGGENEIVVTMNIAIKADELTFKCAYSTNNNFYNDFSVMTRIFRGTGKPQDVVFCIPKNVVYSRLRFDLGGTVTPARIYSLTFKDGDKTTVWGPDKIVALFEPYLQIDQFVKQEDYVLADISGVNPIIATRSDHAATVREIFEGQHSNKPLVYAFLVSVLIFSFWYFIICAKFPHVVAQEEVNQKGGIPASANITLAALVLAVLFFPTLYKNIESPEAANSEKRFKRGFPRMRLESILYYPPGLNGFLEDNFGGRSMLISNFALFEYEVFGVSNKRDVVEAGKEGWLYYVENDTREITENTTPLTLDQMKRIRKTLVERSEWLKLKGRDYYITFPPVTSTIYPEYLPPGLKIFNTPGKLAQLLKFLEETTDLKIVNLGPGLLRAKTKAQVYMKKDTHWNYLGGYAAYRMIIDRIRKDHTELPQPLRPHELRSYIKDFGVGDIEGMIGLPDRHRNFNTMLEPGSVNYVQIPSDTAISARSPIPEYFLVYEHLKDTSLPMLYVNRDSFGRFFMGHLTNHFGRSSYEWTRVFDPASINKVNPDIVITEMLERFITVLETENSPVLVQELEKNGIRVNDAYFSGR